MKSHFSLFNQIGFSQNFVVSSPSKNLLLIWKEVHKRKKKRKSILYLGLLKKQKTQREIAEDLNVSIAKITRGSNELKRTNKKFLNWLRERL